MTSYLPGFSRIVSFPIGTLLLDNIYNQYISRFFWFLLSSPITVSPLEPFP